MKADGNLGSVFVSETGRARICPGLLSLLFSERSETTYLQFNSSEKGQESSTHLVGDII